jgi:hypothetical protein
LLICSAACNAVLSFVACVNDDIVVLRSGERARATFQRETGGVSQIDRQSASITRSTCSLPALRPKPSRTVKRTRRVGRRRTSTRALAASDVLIRPVCRRLSSSSNSLKHGICPATILQKMQSGSVFNVLPVQALVRREGTSIARPYRLRYLRRQPLYDLPSQQVRRSEQPHRAAAPSWPGLSPLPRSGGFVPLAADSKPLGAVVFLRPERQGAPPPIPYRRAPCAAVVSGSWRRPRRYHTPLLL